MAKNINQSLDTLHSLNKERVFWLKISIFIVLISLLTIFNWEYLADTNIVYILTSLGIIISIIWWYWTMMIIRKLITFKIAETELLKDIVDNVQYVREKLQKNIE
jgi:membrane protein YdbS with pleckstrin-like domain